MINLLVKQVRQMSWILEYPLKKILILTFYKFLTTYFITYSCSSYTLQVS